MVEGDEPEPDAPRHVEEAKHRVVREWVNLERGEPLELARAQMRDRDDDGRLGTGALVSLRVSEKERVLDG